MLHVSTNVSNTGLYEATCRHGGRLECASGRLVCGQSRCLPSSRKIARYAYCRAMECNVRLSRQKQCTGHPWSSLVIEPATLLIYHLRRSLGLLPEHRGHYFSARVGTSRAAVLSERRAARTCHLWETAAIIEGNLAEWKICGRMLDRTLRPTVAALLSSLWAYGR